MVTEWRVPSHLSTRGLDVGIAGLQHLAIPDHLWLLLRRVPVTDRAMLYQRLPDCTTGGRRQPPRTIMDARSRPGVGIVGHDPQAGQRT